MEASRSDDLKLDIFISYSINNGSNAWTALEKIFASSSLARVMQLHLELQSTKKDSISMIDYLMKIKGIADSLAAIGEPVSEQD